MNNIARCMVPFFFIFLIGCVSDYEQDLNRNVAVTDDAIWVIKRLELEQNLLNKKEAEKEEYRKQWDEQVKKEEEAQKDYIARMREEKDLSDSLIDGEHRKREERQKSQKD